MLKSAGRATNVCSVILIKDELLLYDLTLKEIITQAFWGKILFYFSVMLVHIIHLGRALLVPAKHIFFTLYLSSLINLLSIRFGL